MKKFLTVLIFTLMSFTTLFFGCKDKYLNFKIEINGESEITLLSGEDVIDEEDSNFKIVEVLIKNAPNDNCRIISYSVSQNNIVTVEEIASTSKDIKRYKITALENITASKPSTIITFFTAEGDRNCSLKVDVEIPITNLVANSGYKVVAVSDGQPYYIDSSKAFEFSPANTTEREVRFELVDETLINRFGVSVSPNGAVVIERYFDEEGFSIGSKFQVRATSVNRSGQLLEALIDVNVLRDLENSEITFSHNLGGNHVFTGDEDTETVNSINSLMQNGLVFASNIEQLKNANFSVEINERFGLNFNDLEVLFDKKTLSNVLIESDTANSTLNKKMFKIYSKNPGVDQVEITIKYKSVSEYAKTFIIPIKVLEYPNSLIVNDSLSSVYNIFDYYMGNSKGQEFKVDIQKIGAFDKTFKINISQEDFECVEIRYLNEILDYENLINMVFENDSSIFVKAKEVEGSGRTIEIEFYSNILKDADLTDLDEAFNGLYKKIDLELIPGIRSLDYDNIVKDELYLEQGKTIVIPYLINGTVVPMLNEFVNLEIVSGDNLVQISKEDNKFTLKSTGNVGEVEFYLVSENGIDTLRKTVKIYAGYNENSEDKFTLDLFGNNIKKIENVDGEGNISYSYFIGTIINKNSANFRILNPQKSTIYKTEISAKRKVENNGQFSLEDCDDVRVSVLNKDELLFNIYALNNCEDTIVIEVKIWVYNDNSEVNEDGKLIKEVETIKGIPFEIKTYEPLTSVTFKNGEISSETTLIDGEALDIDSLNKKMNELNLNDLISIKGKTEGIEVKYIFPDNLLEAEYEVDSEGNKTGTILNERDFNRIEKSGNEIFDKFYFHVAKNHKFINSQYVFGVTISVYDLKGGDEPYILTLKVILKQQVKPDKVVIKNDNGFVYIANNSSRIEQIKAEVLGENGKQVTNGSLYFESFGQSADVNPDTGVITVNFAGITRVRVYAKASKYQDDGYYSRFTDVYVVVADGSKNYPYILTDINSAVKNKYYTLVSDVIVNDTIDADKTPSGIKGEFAYLEYSNVTKRTNSLIFRGTGSIFGDSNICNLENINIVYDQNSTQISENFGLIAKVNSAEINNVSLIINSLQIENVNSGAVNVGLMFVENNSIIRNAQVVSSGNGLSDIALKGNAINFGGLVYTNAVNGEILGNFNFLSNESNFNISLKVIDLLSENAEVLGGLVGENFGHLEGLKVNAEINSNAKYVGGIAGKIESTNKVYKNLYFTGNILSNHTESVVGAIASKVNVTNAGDKIDFELVFAEFLSENNNSHSSICGKLVGGLFGEADFNGDARTNVKYSFVKSYNNVCALKGDVVGGLVGKLNTQGKMLAVYADTKVEGFDDNSVIGAICGSLNNDLVLSDSYSGVSGAKTLVGLKSGKLTLNEVYSTQSTQEKESDDNFTMFFDKYNYMQVISAVENGKYVFNDDNYFKYSPSENGGLPYIVYKESDGYKKLMTVVVKSLNATFVVKDFVQNSNGKYSYGIDKNVVVINDETGNKAVIYYKNGLEYDISSLINLSVSPSDASRNFEYLSLNEKVLQISKSGNAVKIKVVGLGSAGVEIVSVYDKNVRAYVYIDVENRADSINLPDEIVLSTGFTKQMDISLSNKTETNGVYFNLIDTDVASKLLINNTSSDENYEIYIKDSLIMFTGIDNLDDGKVIGIAPFYQVMFGGKAVNFIDYDNYNEINFKIINQATQITSSVNYFAISENEEISFDVYVDYPYDSTSQELVFESLDADDFALDYYFDIKFNVSGSSTQTLFNVKLKALNVNLLKDKTFELKIKHKVNGIVNNDVFASIVADLKSSKLKGVELNHYSSSVHYYDSYSYILRKETNPSFNIVKGNFGVLNINLYPQYANITDIEVTSSIEGGNRINFGQLTLNDNDELEITAHKSNLASGIKLKIDKDEIRKNGGNLYISTLLGTNVLNETAFTITVTVYYGIGLKFEPVTIELVAKPLTTIMLTNNSGKDNFVLAKGGQIEFDINTVNIEDGFEAGLDNFEFSINNNKLQPVSFDTGIINKDGFTFVIDPETKSLFGVKVENGKLIVLSDILNSRNTVLTIMPIYEGVVDGKYVQSEGSKIYLTIADFYVSDVSVENVEDGVLTNYLGNSTILKANLIVETCESIYYYDQSDNIISKYQYFDNDGNLVNVNFDFNLRELEYSNIKLKIRNLQETISKSNLSWNLITVNNSGNYIYNNLKALTNYTNFSVNVDSDGYYYVYGKVVSVNNLLLKVNLSYENGIVSLNENSNNELAFRFALNIKTQSSLDNPTPIRTSEEFLTKLEEGGDYILLNDITLPASFGGINVNISSFDGNNKIINIQGFSISDATITNLGLFNEIGENTVIKNVTVNILPTLFMTDNYYYGLNVNAQALESLNFGVIAGTNNGVITNCKVINNNFRLINNQNAYKEVCINVISSEEKTINIGGLVGENNGYITHSSVGDRTSKNSIKIIGKAQIGGFASVNNNKIASSYVVNTEIHNNSQSKLTAGFVCENNLNAFVQTSYVQGYSENPSEIELNKHILDGGIFANGYVGGFVTNNSGFVKDCYSNIMITTNKRASGFVYDNTRGTVETCLSASTSVSGSQSFRYFTGNDEENLTLNSATGVKYSYYLLDDASDKNGGEGEYDEPANGIVSFEDASFFEGFISDGSLSSIWNFSSKIMPRLVDADKTIISERQLLESSSSEKFEYIYINNLKGSINNPILVASTDQFFEALTNEENLYSYYYNGKIVKTKINYNYIEIIKDLDLSKIIDKNNIESSTTNNVQKLQDIIFAGKMNGNGMELSHITITAQNDKVKYSSFGLFKQIGSVDTYDSLGNVYNNKLGDDGLTVIKNLKLSIDSMTATITKSVGTLSGEVINSKLYNIDVYSNNGVVVTGNNIVGGIAGRISGNSYVKGVSSNLSVKATMENRSHEELYQTSSVKRVYKNAFDILEDELNDNVNIVGGLFGVVDIYKTQIKSFNEVSSSNSYYVLANINRENEQSFDKAQIQFTKVYDNVQISGDIVGGLFGYVASGSMVYDARFVLNESNNQNLNGNYAVGGIAGLSNGYIAYATIETNLARQRQIDKTERTNYLTSYLFSSSLNKATFVGGLVGILDSGILAYSYSKVNIGATNSNFVGSAVGAFANSKIEFVYANSYLKAQKQINENGLIVQQKGYSGFIGTVTSFENGSFIRNVVSLIRNNDESEFGIGALVGYNQTENVAITGEYSSNLTNAVNGNNISFSNNNPSNNNYEDYINQASGTFSGYETSNCFARTSDLDTFYRLTYNKKGAVRVINNENDLRNMLEKGNCELQSDIFLTAPWDPIPFKGTFTSAKRKNAKEGESEYYVIYNLTINSDSKNVSNNVGFFTLSGSEERGATISNITFVVGSNFVDPLLADSSLPKDSETGFYIDENWGNGTNRGIIINNKRADKNYSIGVLSGKDIDSTIKNVTIKFANNEKENNIISSNLSYVGGLIGDAKNTKIEDLRFENLQIKRETQNAIGHDAYIGGVAGSFTGGMVKNVVFSGKTEIYNQQSVKNNNTYIGGVCGLVQNRTELSNIKVDLNGNSSLSVGADFEDMSQIDSNNIYAGLIAGSLGTGSLDKAVIENGELKISNKNKSNLYVGGFAGKNEGSSVIKNSMLKSSCAINVSAGEKSVGNFIGGVVGNSTGNTISNVISASKLLFDCGSAEGYTYFGGIVGLNGGTLQRIINGSSLSNVISKSAVTIKDSKKTNNIYVGGIVGQNVNAEISQSMSVSSIKYYCSFIKNIGGLVGQNFNNTQNISNSIFIEDLSLASSRNVEWGKALKYSDFISKLNNGKIKLDENAVIDIIEINKNIGTIENLNDIDEDIKSVVGENVTFKEGSVYNPIKVDSVDKLLKTENGKFYLGENNVYYLVTKDFKVSSTANEVRGYIVGDAKTITTTKLLAKTISENAVISSFVIKLDSTDNIQTFNNNKFVKNVQSVIGEENLGSIYNIISIGNIYAQESTTPISGVVNKNSGFINVVSAKVHICTTGSSYAGFTVAGFVNSNSGAIYNSEAVGNIEFIENSYKINSKNVLVNKLYGFVGNNEDTIVNCVSGVTLPLYAGNVETAYYNTSFEGNGANSKFINCVVDLFANGDHYVSEGNNNCLYVSFDKLYETVKKENPYENLYTEFNKGVLFGYSYPIISTYKNTEFGNEDVNAELSTAVKDSDDKTYYLVNNFSSFNKIINVVNEDNNESEIRIKQIVSFVASSRENQGKGFVDVYKFETIELKKDLIYDGNNFAIINLKQTTDKNGVAGLFKTTDKSITIKNLAIDSAEIKISFGDEKDGEVQTAIENITVGVLVAKSSGVVNIDNCYISGEINCANNTIKDYKNAKELVVGGFIGKNDNENSNSTISNCVSSLNINLDYLSSDILFKNDENNPVEYLGYYSKVGGIAGQVKNIVINGNWNFGDVISTSSRKLSAGGIVGEIEGGALTSNKILGAVQYKGAYLGYYAGENELIYNINAVVGLNSGARIGTNSEKNLYNEFLSLTKDNTINDETSLETLLNLNPDNNRFAGGSESETIIFEKPEFEKIASNTAVFEDNKNYLITSTNFTFGLGQKEDLTNTKILFLNRPQVKVSKNLFNKLKNVTISNLNFVMADDVTSLKTAVIANHIENTKLYSIALNDIYFERTTYYKPNEDGNNAVGGVCDFAKSSILSNITLNLGRVESKIKKLENNNKVNLEVGGIVGYATETLFINCENSATVTTANNLGFGSVSTAGVVGGMLNSYMFNCKNTGLVYAKNGGEISSTSDGKYTEGNANETYLNTSGLANGVNEKNIISFSKNEGKVKGVNNFKGNGISSYNNASGVSVNTKVLYSINKANIMAISPVNIQARATGIGTLNTYFSYHFAGVMSTSTIYTISASNAYYCYSFGGGYTTSASENDMAALCGANEGKGVGCTDFNAIENGGTAAEETSWWNKYEVLHDFKIIGVNNGTPSTTSIIQPVIRLIDDSSYDLPVNSDDDSYELSTAFDLWYWARYVCGTEKDKNVKILDDIDMTGYIYKTPSKKYTKTFDGQFHTISSLRIKPNEGEEVKLVQATFDSLQVGGLIGILGDGAGNGEVKNINLENPTLLNISTFYEQNLLSIIVGFNNYGKIDNVLVGQTGEEKSFIDLEYNSTSQTGEVHVDIGVIAGYSAGGTITNCEVINLKDVAINYDLSITIPTSWNSNDLFVYTGGIVGCTFSSTVENCAFIGQISGTAINTNMHNVLIGGQQVNDILGYGAYSKLKHFIGLISGDSSGTYNNNYAPANENAGIDDFIHMKSENLYDGAETGNAKTKFYVSRISSSVGKYAVKKGGKIVKIMKNSQKFAKKFVKKKAASLVAKIGIPDPTDIIDIVATGILMGVNSNSYESSIVESGYGNTYNGGTQAFDSDYLKPYYENVGSENSTFNAFKKSIGNEKTQVAFNENFVNLSNATVEPKKIENAYYVYNVNELAYSLSSKNNSVTNIRLMDNIDMTRRIWDAGMGNVKTGLNIIDNGFKIVYSASGDEMNQNFKNSFVSAGYNEQILANNTIIANDYGKFETIKRDPIQAAYDNFKIRFDNAWKNGYKNGGGSDFEAEQALENIYKTVDGENSGKIYPLSYPQQVEIIADAISNYSIEGITHRGLNFVGRTFVLTQDLDLSKLNNIKSFDCYLYTVQVKGVDNYRLYNYKTNQYTYLNDLSDDADFSNYQHVYNAPDFVDAGKGILYDGNVKFNGAIEGNNHTITFDRCLFNDLGPDAVVQNLNVENNAENGRMVSTILDKDTEISTYYALNSLIAYNNEGTIKNVTLNCSNDITFESDLYYSELVQGVKSPKSDEADKNDKLVANIVVETGLICARNYGTISNCVINHDGDLSIKNKLMLDYQTSLTDVEYKDADGNIQYYDITDNNLTMNLNYNGYFGVLVGQNLGYIKDFEMSDENIQFKEISVETKNFAPGEKIVNKENINKSVLCLGLIAGENTYDEVYGYSTKNGDSVSNIYNIALSNCSLTNSIDSESSNVFKNAVLIGMVNGRTSLSIEKCILVGCSIINNQGTTTKTSPKVGMIAGMITPVLVGKSKTYKEDGKTRSLDYFTKFVPQIRNCVSSVAGENLVGFENKFYIKKVQEETKEIDGNKYTIKFSGVYYDDSYSEAMTTIGYYFDSDSSINLGDSENGYGADNYKGNIEISVSISEKEYTYKTEIENIVEGGLFEGDVKNLEELQLRLKLDFAVNINGNAKTLNIYVSGTQKFKFVDNLNIDKEKLQFKVSSSDWQDWSNKSSYTYTDENVQVKIDYDQSTKTNVAENSTTYLVKATYSVNVKVNDEFTNISEIAQKFGRGEITNLPEGFTSYTNNGKQYLKYTFEASELNFTILDIAVD